MSQMSNEELGAWAQKVGELALQTGDHADALTALLSAYFTIATTHTCCTQSAADNCFRVSMLLAQKAAQARPQPGQQVH